MPRTSLALAALAVATGGAVAAATSGPLATPSPERRAVEYLIREVPAWRSEHACGSCHNNGDAARALFRARQLGHAVPEAALESTRQWLLQPKLWEREPGEPGTSDVKLARIQFTAALLAAADSGAIESRRALLTAAATLATDQDADGAWRIAQQTALGSPVAYGAFVATWLARRTLVSVDGERFAREAAQAEAFFLTNPAKNVMDAAASVLGLADAASPPARARRQTALALLREAQTQDGGWGPYAGVAPEVFDTALALLALRQAGGAQGHEAIRRGREFLIRSQLATGGWRETTRPSGYQSYAQHVSTTGWATLALLETAPSRE